MAQPHLQSGDVMALRPLGDAIAGARTTALLKAAQLEVMRVVLLAGRGLPEHAVPGECTLLGIEGTAELRLRDRRLLLRAGDFIHLAANEPHAVHAVEDTSLLLTICLAPG
jgi:quercetin dioxygenase-like cupin family protein